MITGKPLFTVNQIQERVSQMAAEISRDYEGKDILVVCLLKGAFMFTSDLVRQIKVPVTIDFVVASSYVQQNTTGEVKIHCDIREKVKDRDVLLVEDIIDTGITINHMRERLLQMEPASLRICGLLNKQPRRIINVPVDYIGFEIPDLFVVGYGLDYDNRYRNLPYIAEFKSIK